jgi:Domain of unknown function (DUF4268)
VELYASHDVDKTAFNTLHAQKAAIEAEFGEPLLWQELPGKKASRSTPRCTLGCSRRWIAFGPCSVRASRRFHLAPAPRLTKTTETKLAIE